MHANQAPGTTTIRTTASECDPVLTLPTLQTPPAVPAVQADLRTPAPVTAATADEAADEAGYGYGV